MKNLSDTRKQRAAHIAAKLVDAQDRRGVKNLLAGELINEITREDKKNVNQADPRAASLLGERVAALAAQSKSNKARVVLVGESVARGFPYDPHFNCAIALQEFLNLATGSDDAEVIDLAQNGLTYDGLIEIFEAALALKPDAFVVFAGNNWRIPIGVEMDRIAEILNAEKCWQAVVEYLKEKVRQAVHALVSRLSELAARHSIPIVFVIPDFNAVDWQTYYDWRNPLLIGVGGRQWQQLRVESESALADHDYGKAARLARAMIDLDGGLSTAPYETLATCSRMFGDDAGARRFIDRAGDIRLCVPVPKQPYCSPIIRDALRSECSQHPVVTVDLPARISELLSGALPDRKLFLDSCHMTVEGIQLAMACAAESLLPLMGKRKLTWREFNAHQFSVDRRVFAEAHYNAARINARNGQGYEIVRYHFAKAIQHAPEVVDLALLFADLSLRHAPYMMCRTFEELLSRRDVFPSITGLAAGSPTRTGDFNLLEIRALKDAVTESRLEAGERIEQMLRNHHAVQVQEVNLLRHPYCNITFGQLEFEWPDKAIYLQAYKFESRFYLVCDDPCPVHLKLTCRLDCQPMDDGMVSVIVNDCPIGRLRVSTHWSQHALTIPAENLRGGLNSLVLSWPEPQRSPEEHIKKIIKNFEANESAKRWERLPDIYPVYGEVHAFSAVAQPALKDS